MNKGYLLVLSTAIISGFSIFISKFGVSVINPYAFTWLKNIVVALLLTGILFLFKDWKKLKNLTKKQWLLLVVIGLVGGSIPFLLFFKGLSLTTAAQGAFWHKTMFIYVAFMAAIFLKEKIDRKFLFGGLLLVLANIILLKELPHALGQGDLMVILATIFWAVENVISKHALKNLEGRTVAWARMFFGSLFILIFLVSTSQISLLADLTLKQVNWVFITSLLLFGYVMTWYSGLKQIPASQATAILLLGAPITTLLSLISGAKISPYEISAGILFLIGTACIIGFNKIWQNIKDIKKLDVRA